MKRLVATRRRTLVACFLHFDVSFMLWVLFGALGVPIAAAARLGPLEQGVLVALPILSGALLRVPIGLLADRYGGRRVGLALLGFLFVPLALAWAVGPRFAALCVAALGLGAAGASFAVALPLASRWYPAERQGLVMGLAAAGNGGTVVTSLVAPHLAAALGWRHVFGLAAIPLALVLLVFAALAREPAVRPVSTRRAAATLREPDLWWCALFYGITFGGFVGLSSFLPLFLAHQLRLGAIAAGHLTAFLVLLGSLARPLGGTLADRLGGTRVLLVLLAGIALAYLGVARLPGAGLTVALLAVGLVCLGLGNGAVFQIVPQRFAAARGTATGVVGAVGGLGGFLLPLLLGAARGATGSFAPGLVALALLAGSAATALAALLARSAPWRAGWAGEADATTASAAAEVS